MAVQPSCTIIPFSFSISSSSRSLIRRPISPGCMLQIARPRTTSTPSTASIARRSRWRSASRKARDASCSALRWAFCASCICTCASRFCAAKACCCSRAMLRFNAPPVMASATARTPLVNHPFCSPPIGAWGACGRCGIGACNVWGAEAFTVWGAGACGICGRCGIGACGILGACGAIGRGAVAFTTAGCWGFWGVVGMDCPHLVQNDWPTSIVLPHLGHCIA